MAAITTTITNNTGTATNKAFTPINAGNNMLTNPVVGILKPCFKQAAHLTVNINLRLVLRQLHSRPVRLAWTWAPATLHLLLRLLNQ